MNRDTDAHLQPFAKSSKTVLSISANTLIGYAIFEHTFARIFGFFSYLVLGRAIYGQWLCLGVWVILLAFYLLSKPKSHISSRIILSVFIALLFLFINYYCFPNTRQFYSEYRNELGTVVFMGLPCAVLLSMIDDVNELLLSFKNLLRISLILCLIGMAFGIKTSYLSSMGWGMMVMPISVFYYGYCVVAKLYGEKIVNQVDKIFNLIALILSMLGGRQWLVIIAMVVVFCNIWGGETKRKKLLKIFLGFIVLLFFSIFYEDIISILTRMLNYLGIHSRALNSISQNRLLDTFNRNSIYNFCKEIIGRNGKKISGVFADRYYLRQYRYNIAYAHNIFYELLIDFGSIIGSIIAVFMVYCILKGFFSCVKQMRIAFFLFWCYGFLRYIVSSSIFVEVNFLIMFGLVLNSSIRKKYRET